MIQVERSPPARRSAAPVIFVVPADVVTCTVETRPDRPRASRSDFTGTASFSPLRRVASATATGPQRCTGESALCGSSTPTRYGIGVPKTSAASSVVPPEVEWKSASIGLPSQSSTSPFVAWTAAVVRGCSPAIPP